MRYALSDIHGCPKTFRLALHQINFSHEDELFLLGDYIDRGPDSQGVINFIWELEANGHKVICLRGNHEQMLLDHHYNNHRLYEWAPDDSVYHQTMEWMNKLLYFYETPGYILVHAGLDFLNTDPFSDKDEMLWIRYWYGNIDRNWLGDPTLCISVMCMGCVDVPLTSDVVFQKSNHYFYLRFIKRNVAIFLSLF